MTGAAADTARDRAQVYGLLAAIFRRPLDSPQIAALRHPQMLAALVAAGIDPGQDFADAEESALREVLAIDFTHVFHNPEGKIMPFECMMLTGEDELKGSATEEVERFMATVGYRVRPESGEMADHIAVELSFMADLAEREAEALAAEERDLAERSNEIQGEFLREHLGKWVDVFADRVAARAETAFYANLAIALAEFVKADAADLSSQARAA